MLKAKNINEKVFRASYVRMVASLYMSLSLPDTMARDETEKTAGNAQLLVF